MATSHAAEVNSYERVGAQEQDKSKLAETQVMVMGCQESEDEEVRMVRLKQRMVSQVLEIGIIFHSVIIGVTMGMTQNQCTIRPLVAALAFHQIFEGMGLGGCIAQVKDIPFFMEAVG